jgi:alkanesulfonate monooxygenase SsuD/methylene tetrahydromethanopterin reductase-like flavin-dependent oxidoreductase (luciferase family)
MWTEKVPNFDGQYYQIKEAYCEPKPVQKPYPPFVIGGSGEQLTLRVVAKYADIWNFTTSLSAEDFQHKSAVLDTHCAAIGRDPSTIVRSVQLALNPNDDLGALRKTMQTFISAGATHFVLTMRTPYLENSVHRVAKEIIEPLKSANLS